jgi:hypothetical protein
MVRLSKQTRDRAESFRRPKKPGEKSGARKETQGFKAHVNALQGTSVQNAYIPKL